MKNQTVMKQSQINPRQLVGIILMATAVITAIMIGFAVIIVNQM